MSVREVAATLGTSESAVQHQLSEALAQIRATLAAIRTDAHETGQPGPASRRPVAVELDPTLESRLRDALADDADTIPCTLRADTISRIGVERRRTRRARLQASLAAAIVVAVTGIALAAGSRSPSNLAASPSASALARSSPVLAASRRAPSPSSGSAWHLPSEGDLLAAAGDGAVELTSIEGGAQSEASVAPLTAFANRVALAVVVACTGGSSLDVIDAAVPGGGADQSLGAITCDGSPNVVPWEGWGRVVATPPQLALAVGPDAAYRAILVDTSRAPGDGEAAPVAGGLPSLSHLSANGVPGDLIATHELIGPANDAASQVSAADIRVPDALQVLVACVGGQADVSATDDPGSSVTTLGSPVCDGTVQTYLWNRADGPSDAARLRITDTAGTSWRVAVRDLSRPTHPNPNVPCGSTAALKRAPVPTLYQGARALGAIPSYFTSFWGTTHDDGVDVVPTTSLEAKAGIPLQLRVTGNACAVTWVVVYGTAGSAGIGIDPAGALALLPGYAATTTGSRENRIDLASLPPGDWVLRVTLGFDRGAGSALLRVHASG